MKAATYIQNQGYQIEDVPIPQIQEDEILVEVMASSICGTDLRIIRSGHRKLARGQKIVLGHEFAGVVAKAGSRAGTFTTGMRVGVAPNIGCGRCEMCARALPNMCPDYDAFGINMDGSHAQFVRIPHAALAQGSVIPLPPELSFSQATLIEPLSCAVNGNQSCRLQLGETVAIFGAGPIGLLHLMLARHAGASRVILIEPEAHRADKASLLGADSVIDPTRQNVAQQIRAQTGGRGVDVVITACSIPAVQEQSLALLAPFGRVCFFGGLAKDNSLIRLDSNLIHYKNLVVTGVTGGSPQDFRMAMNLIASGRVDVTQVISHTFASAQMEQAFDVALHQETMKVVILANRNDTGDKALTVAPGAFCTAATGNT